MDEYLDELDLNRGFIDYGEATFLYLELFSRYQPTPGWGSHICSE